MVLANFSNDVFFVGHHSTYNVLRSAAKNVCGIVWATLDSNQPRKQKFSKRINRLVNSKASG